MFELNKKKRFLHCKKFFLFSSQVVELDEEEGNSAMLSGDGGAFL
jgi:hypothetical protein